MPTRKILLSLLLSLSSFLMLHAGNSWSSTKTAAQWAQAFIEKDITTTLNWLNAEKAPTEEQVGEVIDYLITHHKLEMLNALHNTVLYCGEPIDSFEVKKSISVIGVNAKVNQVVITERKANSTNYYNVTTNESKALPLPKQTCLESIAFNPVNNQQILTANNTFKKGYIQHFVQLWDLAASKRKTFNNCHDDKIIKVLFSHDGKFGYSASQNGQIVCYDLKPEGTAYSLINAEQSVFTTMAITPDGKYLFTGDTNNIVRCWNAANGELIATCDMTHEKQMAEFRELREKKGQDIIISSISISPDSKVAYINSNDGFSLIWYFQDGFFMPLIQQIGYDGYISDFCKDNLHVATTTSRRSHFNGIHCWNIESRDLDIQKSLTLLRAQAHERSRHFVHLSFSKNGNIVYGIDNMGDMVIWNLVEDLKKLSLEKLVFLIHANRNPSSLLNLIKVNDVYKTIFASFKENQKNRLSLFLQHHHEIDVILNMQRNGKEKFTAEGQYAALTDLSDSFIAY